MPADGPICSPCDWLHGESVPAVAAVTVTRRSGWPADRICPWRDEEPVCWGCLSRMQARVPQWGWRVCVLYWLSTRLDGYPHGLLVTHGR